MIKAYIVDDEPHARETLKLMLSNYCREVEVVGQFSNVKDVLVAVKDQQPDILFMDIEMGEHTGLDLLSKLQEYNMYTVFVTAYQQYALEAIKLSVSDYILKPVDPLELIDTVEKYKKQRRNQSDHTSETAILIPHKNQMVRVPFDQIIRVEADNNYSIIVTKDSQMMVAKTLKSLTEKLPNSQFLRSHSKHLVNKDFVAECLNLSISSFIVASFSIKRSRDGRYASG